MSQLKPPQGYTVAQIDGKWYPLRVDRFYSAMFPEGSLMLYTLSDGRLDAHYAKRDDAVRLCQDEAEYDAYAERCKWERLAVQSNVYPERCVHYVDEIEALRGTSPQIRQRDYTGTVTVFVSGCWCAVCSHWMFGVSVEALVIEDALAQATEECYRTRCDCHRMQDLRLSA